MPSDPDGYDLARVVDGDDGSPLDMSVYAEWRLYGRLRAAAAKILLRNPKVDRLVAAERAGDWLTVDAILSGRPDPH